MESMTGFVSREFDAGTFRGRITIKSLNHRYLEAKVRTPRALSNFENDIRAQLTNKLQRGSVELSIEDISQQEQKNKSTDSVSRFIRDMDLACRTWEKQGGPWIPRPLRMLVLSLGYSKWASDSRETSTENVPAISGEVLNKEISLALDALVLHRREEGSKLRDHLKRIHARMTEIREWVAKESQEKLEQTRQQQKVRIEEACKEWNLGKVTEERLLQEFLVLSDRKAVAEELERLTIHLGTLAEMFGSTERAVGKKLDFLAQELGREWTTLGNKLQVPQIGEKIIEAKLLLEQLREQSLNLL